MNGASDPPHDGTPGHKASRHLITKEAYRRIMAGEAAEEISEFAEQLLVWFRSAYPAAAPITSKVIEDEIRDTWQHRHEMIRGG